MNYSRLTILRIVSRKLAVVALILCSAVAAFATLGDGKNVKSNAPKKSLLNNRPAVKPGIFTLKSGYSFRGNSVINITDKKYISLNTVVTMQKGNTTYILPLRKKILENIKVNIGNRQFRRN